MWSMAETRNCNLARTAAEQVPYSMDTQATDRNQHCLRHPGRHSLLQSLSRPRPLEVDAIPPPAKITFPYPTFLSQTSG